ncbi:hypothetical protein NUW54_g13377 [Trametes sanguinea]|uniref:Uncharacterized protein n=1 Tax=Trametes sanguinea TaxID=158606 RepID=A0ACC1MLK9_9APHY|nr:hypothetical protein NUW54_g13377 [Trametes sanguinea]
MEVPVEHRVDRLRELGAAGFVDAAGVYPDPRQSALLRDQAGVIDLGPARHSLCKVQDLDIGEGDFAFGIPTMRERGIARRASGGRKAA